jgi:hypothetical protein
MITQFDNCFWSTDRTIGIFSEFHFPEFSVQGIEGKESVGEQLAFAKGKFNRLIGLQSAKDPGNHSDNSSLTAGWYGIGWWWFKKNTPVTGRLLWPYGKRLPGKTQDSAMGVGHAGENAGIVHQKFGRKVICPIDDKIISLDDIHDIYGGQHLMVQADFHIGVQLPDLFFCGNNLGFADIRRKVDHLSLQITEIKCITIGNPQFADSCRRQV